MPNSKQNPLLNYRTLTDEERFLNQQNKINAKYDSQINNLNLGKTTQQQQADITRSQLQKYLPYYYKSKGLSGLGLEQSAMLDANANYTNQLGKIESDFTQQKNALENYRQDDLMKAENDYYDRVQNNSTVAYNEVKQQLEDAYGQYIDDEILTDEEYGKLKSSLDAYKQILTDNDYKIAQAGLENYRTNTKGEEQAETGETVSADILTDAMKKGHDYLTINGKKYLIYEPNPIFTPQPSKEWFNRAAREKGYASQYDSNIPNGMTVYNNIAKVTYAYFDGKWYPIKEAN